MKFCIGNVVRNYYGFIIIITKVESNGCRWISFDAENSSGFTKFITETIEETCGCVLECGINDDDCEDCKGSGVYMETYYGLDCATILANNVKEYITKRLLKPFID